MKQLIRSGNAAAELTLEGDGLPCEKVNLSRLMFVACMSHCYEGGGFYFCPGADASDGILDLCTVSGVPKWKVLMVLPTAFTGKHYRYNGVERYSGRSCPDTYHSSFMGTYGRRSILPFRRHHGKLYQTAAAFFTIKLSRGDYYENYL